jgi:GntR family transcriptional regulator, vanillate catabolism transcriptional regulator
LKRHPGLDKKRSEWLSTKSGEVQVASGAWNEDVRKQWELVNSAFHDTMICATNNPHLASMLQKSREIPMINQLKFRWFDINALLRAQEDHENIFEATTLRQVVRAEGLASEHVYKSGQRIFEHWRKYEQTMPAGVRADVAA